LRRYLLRRIEIGMEEIGIEEGNDTGNGVSCGYYAVA
jgi:hypothetical protein